MRAELFQCLLHDHIRFDVKQQVVVVPSDLQQKGRLFLQRPLQVSCSHQRFAVQFHYDVTISDTTSGDGER